MDGHVDLDSDSDQTRDHSDHNDSLNFPGGESRDPPYPLHDADPEHPKDTPPMDPMDTTCDDSPLDNAQLKLSKRFVKMSKLSPQSPGAEDLKLPPPSPPSSSPNNNNNDNNLQEIKDSLAAAQFRAAANLKKWCLAYNSVNKLHLAI